MITVLVGAEEQKPFIVHKTTICGKSPFFTAACSEAWKKTKDGADGVIRLSLVEPEIFAIYLHWTYSTQIDVSLVEVDSSCTNHEEEGHDKNKCEDMYDSLILLSVEPLADYAV